MQRVLICKACREAWSIPIGRDYPNCRCGGDEFTLGVSDGEAVGNLFARVDGTYERPMEAPEPPDDDIPWGRPGRFRADGSREWEW